MPSLLTLTKTLLLVLVLETQGQKWFNEKYSHQPKPLTQEELMKLAGVSTKSLDFEGLLDPMLIPRVSGTQNNVAVREYIKGHMSKLGWTVETDTFEDKTPFGVKQFENIVATLNPDAPRRLVIACHYDSKYFKDAVFVGASDSAVPCAMMLHMAYALEGPFSENQKSAARNVTLQFMFFDGEEAFVNWSETDSTYGSRHLANLLENTPYPPGNKDNTNELHRIDVMMLLDLIGPAQPTFPNFFESTSHLHNQLVETESVLRNSRMWSGNVRATRNYFRSDSPFGGIEDDHIPFIQRNVDVLHLISVPFPSTWHTIRDNKESLDMTTIANLNRVLRVFVGRYLHLSGLDST